MSKDLSREELVLLVAVAVFGDKVWRGKAAGCRELEMANDASRFISLVILRQQPLSGKKSYMYNRLSDYEADDADK